MMMKQLLMENLLPGYYTASVKARHFQAITSRKYAFLKELMKQHLSLLSLFF